MWWQPPLFSSRLFRYPLSLRGSAMRSSGGSPCSGPGKIDSVLSNALVSFDSYQPYTFTCPERGDAVLSQHGVHPSPWAGEPPGEGPSRSMIPALRARRPRWGYDATIAGGG